VPRSIVLQDGMDFCRTTYTYEPAGQRKMVNYADQPAASTPMAIALRNPSKSAMMNRGRNAWPLTSVNPSGTLGLAGHSVFTAYKRLMRIEAGNVQRNICC